MSEQENSAPKSGTFQVSEGEHKSLQGIESWSFDVFQVEDDQLPMLVEKIFRSLNIFNNFPIDMHKFRAFVRAVSTFCTLSYICCCVIVHAKTNWQ